ncbi:MAG: hypothetical protein J7539_10550 [Niabella sp.]|nr:hypothetical protein [Niabella sp.]
MNKNIIKFGMFLLGALLLLANSSFAQYRRHMPRPRYYHYRSAPRVSVGIGVGGYGPMRPYYGYARPGFSFGFGLPIGAFYGSLPIGYSRFYFGGIPYYYYDNTYYIQSNQGYEVVAPPLGGTLQHLPRGTRLVRINGQNYYEFNGTYFSPDIDGSGRKYYVVVGTNGELNLDEADKARSGAENNQNYRDAPNDNHPGSLQNTPMQQETPDYNNDDNSKQENAAPAENNGSYDANAGYDNRPQVGDQFDQLPKNSKAVNLDGKRVYVSPAGTYYKTVTVDGKTVYEVTDNKR